MKSFNIENGKVIMDTVPTYGWLRKEDVLYYLMSNKAVWEEQLQYYTEDDHRYYDIKGRILALDMAIDEIKKS